MSDELTIDGEQFISSKRASELSGYEQDYIGQLSRGGQIKARRVGGLWYISVDSLIKYKERAEKYKPEPPIRTDARSDPDSLLSFDGRGYISASRASKLTGYSPDYVGQMARAGTILSRQVGNRWYVEQAGIIKHKEIKDALLGAVQAESVGINRLNLRESGLESFSYAGAGPFLEYTSDTRELMPILDKEVTNSDLGDSTNEHPIPIRVLEEKNASLPSHNRRYENAILLPALQQLRIPEKTRYSLALPAVVLTVTVVLSLGFISLKSSSIYANNDRDNRNLSESTNKAFTAGVASVMVNRVADLLEVFLAPELVYIRGK